MRILSITAASLAFAAIAVAQSGQVSISPAYAHGQVNSNNVYPHATSPMRYQQIHDAWTFSYQAPTVIREIRYRPSNQTAGPNYLNQPAASVEVEIYMGLAAQGVDSTQFNTTGDQNFDQATRKAVFSRKMVNYPSSGATAEELKIFDIKFPFDSAQVFIYTPAIGRSLVVETRQFSRSGGYAFDFVASGSTAAGNGFAIQNGSFDGCPTAGNSIPGFEADSTVMKPGGSLSFTASYDAPQIPTILALGTQRLGVTLAPTQCAIMNDLMVLTPGLTDSSNTFAVNGPIPNAAGLAELRFYMQAFFLEPKANALGIVASRSLYCGIGRGSSQTAKGIVRLWESNNPTSPTLSRSAPNGLVMWFGS
jgi:hypothetical protein